MNNYIKEDKGQNSQINKFLDGVKSTLILMRLSQRINKIGGNSNIQLIIEITKKSF